MNRKTHFAPAKWLSLVFAMVSLWGCSIRPNVDASPLPGAQNTFRAAPFFRCQRVHKVDVFLHDAGEWRLAWRVESEDGTPAEEFTVAIGRIPDGFVQMVPATEGETFYLTKGQEYRIIIWPEKWPGGVDPFGPIWVAE